MRSLLSLVLILTVLALVAGSRDGHAAKEIPRIALLLSSRPGSGPQLKSNVDSFMRELQSLGYIEGKTIAVEHLEDMGRRDRWPQLAAAAVRREVSVIVTSGPSITKSAMNTTKTIPIVMVIGGGNPVGRGLVKSLRRPGGNVTGLSSSVEGLNEKRLEFFKETLPSVSRVAVLVQRRAGARSGKAKIRAFQRIAPTLKMDMRPVIIQSADQLQKGFSDIIAVHPDALIILGRNSLSHHAKQIAAFATKNRLPSMYESSFFVKQGGMMSFGVDWGASWRRAAVYVDKIMKGAKPAILPVEPPAGFKIVFNMKTAREIGVTIPAEILLEANEVLQ